MNISRRAAGALLTAAVLAGSVASPAAAATTLPALDPARLTAAIAGLPDAEASGALVRIRGSGGSWSGSSGSRGWAEPRRPGSTAGSASGP